MRDRGGSLRQRRPGVWEIRVAIGTDPVTGRTVQRSVTFHGNEAAAEQRCRELAAEYAYRRDAVRAAPFLTVRELLERWLAAEHDWKPSTWIGHRSNARALTADASLVDLRVVSLTPQLLRTAMARWTADGATVSVVSGRFRILRAAIGWAYDQRIIDRHPVETMRGPPRPEPRRHVEPAVVCALLTTAHERVDKARAELDGTRPATLRLHRAEQDLLLVRVAADSGARRGELTALQFGDIDGRILTIRRGVSANQVATTKTGRVRRMTLSSTTARMFDDFAADWVPETPADRWLFSPTTDHTRHWTAEALGHRFSRLRGAAGVEQATLHQLRHSVATFLVGRGQILKAQARLGHRDASTTLRNYAHALPLDDGDVADAMEQLLATEPNGFDPGA